MLGVEIYYSVKTLFGLGKNISQISKELEIDRKTIRKIKEKIKKDEILSLTVKRKSIMDPFKEQILEYLKQDLPDCTYSSKAKRRTSLPASYSCVKST